MDRERATQALMYLRDAQLLLSGALFLEAGGAPVGEVIEAWQEARVCLSRAVLLLSEIDLPSAAVPWVQEAKPS